MEGEFAEAGADEPPGRQAKCGVSEKAEPNPEIKVEFPTEFFGTVQHEPDVGDGDDDKPGQPREDEDTENGVDAGLIRVFGAEG